MLSDENKFFKLSVINLSGIMLSGIMISGIILSVFYAECLSSRMSFMLRVIYAKCCK
jgi:hypothetical protein